MLIAVAIAAAVLLVVMGRRVPWSLDTAQLGSVSERWLAEYRASHPS